MGKQLSNGRDKADVDSSPGHLIKSDENVKKLRTLLSNGQCLTVRMSAEELNINRENVKLILMENLWMK
jgi:hypothetical protein